MNYGDEKVKAGEVVRLLSGGAAMTVARGEDAQDNPPGHVRCVWHDTEHRYHSETIPVAALTRDLPARVMPY